MQQRFSHGFSLIELLVAIAIIVILAALIFPAYTKAQERAKNAQCLSNLRVLGMGLLLYAGEHGGKLPGPGTGETDGHAWMRGTLNPYVGVSEEHPAWKGAVASVKGTPFYCPAERTGTGSNGASLAGYNASGITLARDLGYGRNAIWAQAVGSGGASQTEIDFNLIRIPGYTISGTPAELLSRFPLLMDANHYNVDTSNFSDRYALRHGDRANAVFADGHVQTVWPIPDVNSFRNFLRGKGQ